MTTSAASGVFQINELIESILKHATPKDVLLWQRVNTSFRAVIIRSPALQAKIFFKIKVHNHLTDGPEYNIEYSPFLPLLMTLNSEDRYRKIVYRFRSEVQYPKASWRDMFISSPAPTVLSVWHGVDISKGFATGPTLHWPRESTWNRTDGFKLGRLAEIVADWPYCLIDTKMSEKFPVWSGGTRVCFMS